MATQKKKTTQKTKATNLEAAYKAYVLEHEKRPKTAYHFAKEANVDEAEVYDQYGSVEAIEQSLMKNYLKETLKQLKGDSNYDSFMARERLLGFFFTLLGHLKKDRSFLKTLAGLHGQQNFTSVEAVRKLYISFVEELIAYGEETGEVESRPVLSKVYPKAFWGVYGYLMGFWIKDSSPGFEQTDAAVEKAVNLLFDGLSKSVFDSLLDFGKFNFQQRSAHF